MATKGLNDADVANEMNKMVSFIKQEALEKAREIKVKADEEFNIEKAKLVRQEALNIEAFYEKKAKQAEVQKRIQQSTHVNKSRLRLLEKRQAFVNQLLDEARVELKNVDKDQAKYQKLIKDLLLQAFFQVMEPEVTVQCRPQDAAYVSSIIPQVSQEYEAHVKQPIKATLDTSSTLAQDSAGGVIVSAMGDRIRVANTLEARLEELAKIALPDIRTLLFGVSNTRAFYN